MGIRHVDHVQGKVLLDTKVKVGSDKGKKNDTSSSSQTPSHTQTSSNLISWQQLQVPTEKYLLSLCPTSKEPNIETLLRTYVQECRNAVLRCLYSPWRNGDYV